MARETSGSWEAGYTRYTAGAVVLHWTIAAAILAQIAGGLLMVRLELPEAARFGLFQWHKTMGLLILALTAARIVWRLLNPPPGHAPEMARAERVLSSAVHLAFYALLVIVPLSGWIVVSIADAQVETRLFLRDDLIWPHLPLREPLGDLRSEAATLGETAHLWLALSFLGLLALHVAGALKHMIADHLPSLARMSFSRRMSAPGTRSSAVPLAVLAFAAVLGGGLAAGQLVDPDESTALQAQAPAAVSGTMGQADAPLQALEGATAPMWEILPEPSALTFSGTFGGSDLPGTIADWSADIAFSPDDLAGSRAEIRVQTASLTVENSFVSPQLHGSDGLASAEFPEATIRLDTFEPDGDDYLARGEVELKGVTRPVVVPFAFTPTPEGLAVVSGRAELDRFDFEIGVSNDPDGSDLGRTVVVAFDLLAQPAD